MFFVETSTCESRHLVLFSFILIIVLLLFSYGVSRYIAPHRQGWRHRGQWEVKRTPTFAVCTPEGYNEIHIRLQHFGVEKLTMEFILRTDSDCLVFGEV